MPFLSVDGLHRKMVNGSLHNCKLPLACLRSLAWPSLGQCMLRVCTRMNDSFECATHHDARYDCNKLYKKPADRGYCKQWKYCTVQPVESSRQVPGTWLFYYYTPLVPVLYPMNPTQVIAIGTWYCRGDQPTYWTKLVLGTYDQKKCEVFFYQNLHFVQFFNGMMVLRLLQFVYPKSTGVHCLRNQQASLTSFQDFLICDT